MRSAGRRAAAPSIALLALTTVATLSGVLAAAPASARLSRRPPQVVVAPSSAVDSLNGLAVARDGSGGIVFLETVAGVPHVFVSRLEQGAWQRPEQVDAGLAAASSQPQIAAHDHGELVVAFVNSGAVYVNVVRNQRQRFSAPREIAAGAADPSVSLNPYGVGYLAYTAQDGAGDDVDVDYFDGRVWSPASPHDVNVTAADNAGTGAGAPDVAAASDGVGIVTWGENGHIYARRVWGTATSVQTQQLDPSSFLGWTEVGAASPRISVGGDSTFPVVVFAEEFTAAGRVQTRVLSRRLVAETAWGPIPVDKLSVGSGDAGQPQVAFGESGSGYVTAVAGINHRVIATPVAADGYIETPVQLIPGGGAAAPYAAPASAGRGSVIAWQRTPKRGRPRILVSWGPYGAKGGEPRAPVRVSAPATGPTDAALGLVAGGDDSGDAVVAWVQGRAGRLSIDAAELLAGPGSTGGRRPIFFTNRSRPTLRWPAASESWGPLSYTIRLDGSVVGRTRQLQWRSPKSLNDGPHSWQLKTTNEVQKSSTGPAQTVFVDTHPPVLHVRLGGRQKAGETLRLALRYADLPNPKQRGAPASGVAGATVNWGDRAVPVARDSRSPVKRHVHGGRVYYTVTVTHVYPSGGHRTVTVTVDDRAGNATSVTQKLVIRPGPKPRHKRRSHT